VQPWQYALPTDEQLRNPLNIIPPDQRPRVPLRYGAQNELLVSGLLSGGGDIAQRPAVVDSPMGRGHSVLFAINPHGDDAIVSIGAELPASGHWRQLAEQGHFFPAESRSATLPVEAELFVPALGCALWVCEG